jgi:hypothetical protein
MSTNWRRLILLETKAILHTHKLAKRGYDASNGRGEEVAPTDGGAVRFSVRGAVERAAYELDAPNRSVESVLDLLDRFTLHGSWRDESARPDPHGPWLKTVFDLALEKV